MVAALEAAAQYQASLAPAGGPAPAPPSPFAFLPKLQPPPALSHPAAGAPAASDDTRWDARAALGRAGSLDAMLMVGLFSIFSRFADASMPETHVSLQPCCAHGVLLCCCAAEALEPTGRKLYGCPAQPRPPPRIGGRVLQRPCCAVLGKLCVRTFPCNTERRPAC